MLVEMSIVEFNQVLASDAPAPGGGSVAALSGAVGANLITMVCNLSSGRAAYESHQGEIQRGLEASQALSKALTECVDNDAQAFNGVMAAFRMPKGTDEEKAARSAAIQSGYKEAIQSPLRVAQECFKVMEAAHGLMGKTNENALSDLAVAAEQAYAGLMGGSFNVRINLPSIKDQEFVEKTRKEVDALIQQGEAVLKRTRAHFLGEFG